MEKIPPVHPNQQKAPVKMIKVPVKRPVGAPPVRMVKVPAGSVPHPQGGVPVRMIKTPVPAGQKMPEVSAVHVARPPVAPPTVPEPSPRMPAPSQVYSALPEEESFYDGHKESKAYEETPETKPFPYLKNVSGAIRKQKLPEQKLFCFSLLLRMWAEQLAEKGQLVLPELRLKFPKTPEEFSKTCLRDGLTALDIAADDALTLINLFPRLKQLNESAIPLDRLLEKEAERFAAQKKKSIEDHFALSWLLVKIDFQIQRYDNEIEEYRRQQREKIDEIKDIEAEQKAMKEKFVKAIKRKGFPVDAEKLVKNYFTFAKKEPEKAYKILTTNPLYFSPVIMEKISRKCFGLVKAGPDEAKAVNKKLASFLKGLKA